MYGEITYEKVSAVGKTSIQRLGSEREADAFLGTLERLERRSRKSGEVMTATSRREDEPLDPALAPLTDPETGIANRVHFDVVYRVVFAAGTRGFPMALLLLEPERLSEAGDARRQFARGVDSVTRSSDLVARFDESRFALLLLSCNIHGARIAAERLLQTLTPWLEIHETPMAIGAAAIVPEMTSPDDLTRMAEAALAAASAMPGNAIETRP